MGVYIIIQPILRLYLFLVKQFIESMITVLIWKTESEQRTHIVGNFQAWCRYMSMGTFISDVSDKNEIANNTPASDQCQSGSNIFVCIECHIVSTRSIHQVVLLLFALNLYLTILSAPREVQYIQIVTFLFRDS